TATTFTFSPPATAWAAISPMQSKLQVSWLHTFDPMLHDMPIAEMYVPYPIFVLVRFHRWDDVPGIARTECKLVYDGSVLAFRARVRICSKKPNGDGRSGTNNSRHCAQTNACAQEFSMYSNKAQTFLDLAENILDARIAAAKGGNEQAIKLWEKAVEIVD